MVSCILDENCFTWRHRVIGKHLSSYLAENGHKVTAVSRNPRKNLFNEKVKPVYGDVTKPNTLKSLFKDIETVINLVALDPMKKPRKGDKMHLKVHFRGTKNLLRASMDQKVDKFFQMSALGADPTGPTHYMRAKGKAEQEIKNSGIPYIIFRPSIIFGEGAGIISFLRNVTTPLVTVIPESSAKFQPMWINDLVPLIRESLEKEKYLNQVFEVGGPETVSLKGLIKLFYRAQGKKVKIIEIPDLISFIGLSITDKLGLVPFGLDQYRSLNAKNILKENDVKKFGLEEKDLKKISEYF